MTTKEAAIIQAYTNICLLSDDNIKYYYKYVEELLGFPIFTHERFQCVDLIKKKATDDFIKLCEDIDICYDESIAYEITEDDISTLDKENTIFYIAGKITGNDNYMADFANGEKYLKDLGFTAINPALVTAPLPEKSTTWEQYMAITHKCQKMCNAIYILNGWEDSRGTRKELEYALRHNHKVVFESSPFTVSPE